VDAAIGKVNHLGNKKAKRGKMATKSGQQKMGNDVGKLLSSINISYPPSLSLFCVYLPSPFHNTLIFLVKFFLFFPFIPMLSEFLKSIPTSPLSAPAGEPASPHIVTPVPGPESKRLINKLSQMQVGSSPLLHSPSTFPLHSQLFTTHYCITDTKVFEYCISTSILHFATFRANY